MYVFLVGALYLVIAWRYGEPFLTSLGWTFPIPKAFLVLAAGPVLAIALSALGVFLRAPLDSSQIEVLIKSRASLAAIILFGVVLAPIVEEMLFRGFLLPLLVRSMGPWLGILLTAVPFALLHGTQNHWAWQPVVLIGIAGIAFGYVRYKTGSTTAAFLMHSAYNAMGFLGYTLTHWQTLELEAAIADQFDGGFGKGGADFRGSESAQFALTTLLQAGAGAAKFVAADSGMAHEFG